MITCKIEASTPQAQNLHKDRSPDPGRFGVRGQPLARITGGVPRAKPDEKRPESGAPYHPFQKSDERGKPCISFD